MAVEAIGYLNASYIFDAIELGSDEQEQFSDNFKSETENIDLKLVARHTFSRLFSEFLKSLDNKDLYEEYIFVSHWYPEAKFINVDF